MKKKIYVVWQGREPGIYTDWEACEAQVKGFAGARFQSFATMEQAKEAFANPPQKTEHRPIVRKKTVNTSSRRPVLPALAVDAACSGNPGVLEFRGVVADTGSLVFHRGPYPEGTNNIGEFLGIVLGLAYLEQHNLPWALYSDSKIAIGWVKEGHAKTKLTPSEKNRELFEMIQRAEHWLATHTYTTPLYKWETRLWGEIPADFGRK